MALSKGCTIVLIIVAVIAVILIAAVIYVVANKEKIAESLLEKGLSYIEKEMVANLPPGYTEDSVHQILQEFKVAVKEGRIDQEELQELQGYFQVAMADQKLDEEETAQILGLLQGAMGKETEELEDLPDSLEIVPDSL